MGLIDTRRFRGTGGEGEEEEEARYYCSTNEHTDTRNQKDTGQFYLQFFHLLTNGLFFRFRVASSKAFLLPPDSGNEKHLEHKLTLF